MRESDAQIGRALRSPREQVNAKSRALFERYKFQEDLAQQNPSNSDADAEVANSHWKVMVWESQTVRLRLIDRVISDCGAQANGSRN